MFVCSCLTTWIHTTVDLSGKTLETSIRLTVTVYSPSRELTVDLCFVQIGWKPVEISFCLCRHDRTKTLIFILVLVRFPPCLAFEALFSRVFHRLTSSANPFAPDTLIASVAVRDRREIQLFTSRGARGTSNVLAYLYREAPSLERESFQGPFYSAEGLYSFIDLLVGPPT